MESIIDLPMRESTASSARELPTTVTVTMPSFFDFVKAGAAATVGVVLVLFIVGLAYATFLSTALLALVGALSR